MKTTISVVLLSVITGILLAKIKPHKEANLEMKCERVYESELEPSINRCINDEVLCYIVPYNRGGIGCIRR